MGVWDATCKSNEPADYVMMWGKHKGKRLGDIPRSWLEWAVRGAESVSPHLREKMERVLGVPVGSTAYVGDGGDRNDWSDPRVKIVGKATESVIDHLENEKRAMRAEIIDLRSQLSMVTTELRELRRGRDQPTDMERFKRVVKQWFAAMSRQFHPDHGGSPEKQVVLNLCYRDLMRRLEEG